MRCLTLLATFLGFGCFVLPPAAIAWEALSTFKDCDVCPEMVVIPAGNFMMGSPSDEKWRDDDEGPQHRVTIRKLFAVGKYEIMFRHWDACVTDDGCNGYRPDDERWGRDGRPVIKVSWKDAQSYVRWLSRKTEVEYRLLSEAEWEYAARAGTTTPFHFGSSIDPDQAKIGGLMYFGGGPGLVGSFPSNAFGLHDMHGNVWEWSEDCWNNSYAEAPSDGAAWTTGDCEGRVLRGGSFNVFPSNARSANRLRSSSGLRDYYGFRVARTLP